MFLLDIKVFSRHHRLVFEQNDQKRIIIFHIYTESVEHHQYVVKNESVVTVLSPDYLLNIRLIIPSFF